MSERERRRAELCISKSMLEAAIIMVHKLVVKMMLRKLRDMVLVVMHNALVISIFISISK